MRSLADAVSSVEMPDLAELRPAAHDLRGSLAAIEMRIETGQHGVYMRAAALIDVAARALPSDGNSSLVLALRDLTMLDSALARLAGALDMQIRDHDTTDLLGESPTGQRLAPT